jgi:3-polyprenyl-4-hydroxybenzoate decarboxylase
VGDDDALAAGERFDRATGRHSDDLDPSCEKSAQFGAFRSDQMGIDATIKIPERFTEYPEVSKADPEAVAAIAKKLAGIV